MCFYGIEVRVCLQISLFYRLGIAALNDLNNKETVRLMPPLVQILTAFLFALCLGKTTRLKSFSRLANTPCVKRPDPELFKLLQVVVEGLDVGEHTHGVWLVPHVQHVVNLDQSQTVGLLLRSGEGQLQVLLAVRRI